MADQQKVAYGLSNGTIFNYLEWPLTYISRSWLYSPWNNSTLVYGMAPFAMILRDP